MSSQKTKTDEMTPGETVEKFVLGFTDTASCPEALKPHLKKAAPVLGKVADGAVKASLVASELYEKALVEYEKLRPYKLDLLLPGLVGLILCFFGGSFLTLIAAVEAYRMVGFESTYNALHQLYEDFHKVVEANKKDDSVDADGDGVKDVKQISHAQLVKRKTLVFLRTIDPNRVAVAVAGINAGFLAVCATLKMKFARTITLGNAIGESLERPAERYLVPLLEKVIPEEYHRWIRPSIQYSVRTAAISIAWVVQRVISAFHSAIRGGLMFSRNILEYLNVMNIYHVDHEKTYIDELVGYGVALLGLFFQLSRGFSLPFPLNVLLFPFTLIEYFLIWAVNNVH